MPAPKDPIKYAEWKEKIRITSTGRKMPPRTKEHLLKLSKANKGKVPWIKGKKQTIDHIRKRIEARIKNGTTPRMTAPRGESHYLWMKDRSKLAKRQERNDSAYREWRNQVYKRDSYRCRIANNDCNRKNVAHHILPWSKFPELRYEVNNGITLCHAHHPKARSEEKRLIPIFKDLVSVSK